MSRTGAAFLLLAIFLAAGCTQPDAPAASANSGMRPAPAAVDEIPLQGNVFDASLRPIEGAIVTALTLDMSTKTDADGAFDLGLHPRAVYPLQATAAGHLPSNVSIAPDDQDPVRIILQRGIPVEPRQQTIAFDGVLQCAFEAFIISPSCDSALVAAGADPVFETQQGFLFAAEPGWKTIVLDVVFEPDAHPGLDGLRIALRGSVDADDSGSYQQYGRWHGSGPFVVRIEPGGNYTDGVEPVPEAAAGFKLDVYPHSHGYHPGGAGLLGVGAALDVEFRVFVTTFYVDAAPEGYSFVSA